MNSTSKQLNEPIQSTDSIDIRDLFTILWNKKFFIASFSLITTLLMMVYSLSIPNTYTSFALLTPTDSLSVDITAPASGGTGVGSAVNFLVNGDTDIS